MSFGVPTPLIRVFSSSQFPNDQRHGPRGSPEAIGPCVLNYLMVVGCGMASAIMTISTASDHGERTPKQISGIDFEKPLKQVSRRVQPSSPGEEKSGT